jgi:hypothetical protein
MAYLVLIYAGGIAVTAILAAASGILAKVVYLTGCVALSAWSRKNPWDYLLLTLWIAALTPFAGRLVDLAAGWDATNIMLTAPFLVTAPMIMSILERIRRLDAGLALFPSVVVLCTVYGFVVTLLWGEPVPGLIGAADWGVPVIYYFFIVVHRDRLPELLERLPRFVMSNMLLLGSYGVWQFVDPPIWDRFWMKSVDIGAFGLPEPFMVRVFSTLNSQGPFSCWVMVLIIISFGFSSPLMPLARIAGALALAFTSVRTSWGGLAIALVVLMVSSGRKALRYMAIVAAAGFAIIAAVAFVPHIDEVISKRVATFENLSQDGSLLDREEEAARMQTLIADNPFGVGIGRLGRGTIAAGSGQMLFAGPIDDGVLEIYGSLGWVVGLVYCAALAGTALRSAGRSRDFALQQKVCFAAGLACLAALPLTNIVTGVTGTLMWTMFALSSTLGGARLELSSDTTRNIQHGHSTASLIS